MRSLQRIAVALLAAAFVAVATLPGPAPIAPPGSPSGAMPADAVDGPAQAIASGPSASAAVASAPAAPPGAPPGTPEGEASIRPTVQVRHATGAPAAWCLVELRAAAAAAPCSQQVWSDARGVATFAAVAPGEYEVAMLRPRSRCIDGSITLSATRPFAAVTVAPEGGRGVLRGVVVDAGGRALAGIAVRVKSPQGPGDCMQTAPAGVFVLEQAVGEPEDVELAIDGPGHEPRMLAVRFGCDLGAVELQPTVTLRLQLFDETRAAPIPCFGVDWVARVSADGPELRRGSEPVRDRADGCCELRDVPSGLVELVARLPDHCAGDGLRMTVRHPMHGPLVWFVPGQRAIAVRVVDVRGEPLPGCAVTVAAIAATGGAPAPPVRTDSLGRATLRVRLRGALRLRAERDGAATERNAPQDVDDVTLQLATPLAALHGVVGPDADFRALMALPGARCHVHVRIDGERDQTAAIAADGAYRCDALPPGPARLSFVYVADGGASFTRAAATLELRAGEIARRDVDVGGLRVVAVAGRVDCAGRACRRVRLRALERSAEHVVRDVLLPIRGGRFEGSVPAGTFLVAVDGDSDGELWLDTLDLTTDRFDIDLAASTGSLRLRLLDADGAPLAHRTVVLSRAAEPLRSLRTDLAGNVAADGLGAGSYEVELLSWAAPPRPGDLMRVGAPKVGRRTIGSIVVGGGPACTAATIRVP